MAGIDNKECIGHTAHILDAAKAAIELDLFTRHIESLFLVETALERTIRFHRLYLLEAIDRLTNSLVVCEHTAKPAMVHIGHSATLRLFTNDILRRTLGADKQNFSAIGCKCAKKVHSVIKQRKRLLQVDDMDLVAVSENVR